MKILHEIVSIVWAWNLDKPLSWGKCTALLSKLNNIVPMFFSLKATSSDFIVISDFMLTFFTLWNKKLDIQL